MDPHSDNTVPTVSATAASTGMAARGRATLPFLLNAVRTSRAFARRRPLITVYSTMFASLLLVFTAIVAAYDTPPSTPADADGVPEPIAEAEKDAARYAIVNPELVNSASTVVLLGTVISNETANIFPRRDGIVEDITVDIGDTVKKGQVVALLLPKGIEGESAAAIARKKAEKARMEAEYETAQNVARQSLNKVKQEIDEKREELAVARRQQEGMLQRFALAAANVEQMQDQAFVIVRSARQTIERLLLGSNARSNINFKEEHILPALGVLMRETRYNIVPPFNTLRILEDAYADAPGDRKEAVLRELLTASQKAFPAMHALIASTDLAAIPLPGRNGMTFDPAEMTREVHEAQTMVLEAKEKWENALLAEKELREREPELTAKFRGDVKDAQSNEVKIAAAGLRTMEEGLLLAASEQEQMVKIAEQGVRIADAELRMEAVQSGDRQIRSPFTGVVAKRFIDVGQIVMSSDPAFELTGVSTSLAKKAKEEIQFGLPENLLFVVNVGDTVRFFRQSDDEEMYEAIVTRKSPQVDAESHTVMVLARIPSDVSLPHRTSVRVRLTDGDRPIFRVPATAIKRTKDLNFVWSLPEGSTAPERVTVSVIAEDGEFAEITGPITAESRIVLDSPLLFGDDAAEGREIQGVSSPLPLP